MVKGPDQPADFVVGQFLQQPVQLVVKGWRQAVRFVGQGGQEVKGGGAHAP